MADWSQISFEDAVCVNMLELIYYHDLVMFIILMVLTLVVGFILFSSLSQFSCRLLGTSQKLELGWTCFPMVLIAILVAPSIHILYMMEEVVGSYMTIKVIGHQWYWEYQYPKVSHGVFSNFSYDSYMTTVSNLNSGSVRLMTVDKPCVLPVMSVIRILVTSADVLHCWTLNGLGVKVDAVPGRVNELNINALRCGIFRGQCSELCGVNHSFMPIEVEIIPLSWYIKWMSCVMK